MHSRLNRFPWLFLLMLLLTLAQPPPAARAAASTRIVPAPGKQRGEDGYVYTIRPNDTLWDIAIAHDITVDRLIAANSTLDPRRLRPGGTIFVPAEPAGAVPGPAPEPAAAASSQADPAAPSQAAALALSAELAGWPEAMLARINGARAANGLPGLIGAPALAAAAQAHATELAQQNRGSHIGSDGATLRERLARAGIAPRWASENWANAQSVQHAFALWWNEQPGRDPHRRNILSPNYTEIGIGVAAGPWGFYFVADFGG
jgi:uncharacterized protein YkwD